AAQALARTRHLAQQAERWGYRRFWLAEHHNTPQLACPSPEVLIGYLLGQTSRIRIGSGGVMLQHYSAYKVAENFNLLAALAPGRVDLGVGKAPGGLPLATQALQAAHDRQHKPAFPQQLSQLTAYLNDDAEPGLSATPLPPHGKLTNPVGDALFELLSSLQQPVDLVFCCLGTTRRAAGSADAFRYVDYQLVVESALTGRRLGAQHCLVVSALGANADSTFLYNRTKGEMEQALREQHWPRLTLVRPSMLVGDRPAPRLIERLTLPLFRLLPGKWRAVSAKDVAQTLLQQAFTPGEGVRVLESDRLHCYRG
uniref:MsnO8 family LLM class oxidoreductase n=1 Tax=Serratia marcescens TaxID=615 RepID=UPI002020CE19